MIGPQIKTNHIVSETPPPPVRLVGAPIPPPPPPVRTAEDLDFLQLRLASLNAGDIPAPSLNNKTLVVATGRHLCAPPCVCGALYVKCASLSSMRGQPLTPL